MPDALHTKCVVFRIITLHSSIDSMVELLVASRNTFNRAFSSLSLSRTFFFYKAQGGILKRKIEGEKAQKSKALPYFYFTSFPLCFG